MTKANVVARAVQVPKISIFLDNDALMNFTMFFKKDFSGPIPVGHAEAFSV